MAHCSASIFYLYENEHVDFFFSATAGDAVEEKSDLYIAESNINIH